jgi:hypothetical protein
MIKSRIYAKIKTGLTLATKSPRQFAKSEKVEIMQPGRDLELLTAEIGRIKTKIGQ